MRIFMFSVIHEMKPQIGSSVHSEGTTGQSSWSLMTSCHLTMLHYEDMWVQYCRHQSVLICIVQIPFCWYAVCAGLIHSNYNSSHVSTVHDLMLWWVIIQRCVILALWLLLFPKDCLSVSCFQRNQSTCSSKRGSFNAQLQVSHVGSVVWLLMRR